MRLLDYEKDITNNGGSLFPIIKSNVLNPGRSRPGELTLSRCVLVGSDLKSNNDSMFAIVCLQSKNVVPNMVTPNCIITGEECRGMHSFYPATDKLPLLSNPQE